MNDKNTLATALVLFFHTTSLTASWELKHFSESKCTAVASSGAPTPPMPVCLRGAKCIYGVRFRSPNALYVREGSTRPVLCSDNRFTVELRRKCSFCPSKQIEGMGIFQVKWEFVEVPFELSRNFKGKVKWTIRVCATLHSLFVVSPEPITVTSPI